MLLSLHVRNLALIEEEEISFEKGLNVLTGETGAGKSILLGGIALALGGRADKGVIRSGADQALIELVYEIDTDAQRARLQEMGIEPEEDNTILMKRRILPGRSSCQVNGESVTMSELRSLGELLVDFCGQRENQRLLRREQQLEVLDEFAGSRAQHLRVEAAAHYRQWQDAGKKYESSDLDSAARMREMDLIAYEIQEIESAALRDGEEEELEAAYRKLSSFRKISGAVQGAHQLMQGGEDSAADQLGRACRLLTQVQGLDGELDEINTQLSDADALLSDAGRALADYMDTLSFDPEEFARIEDRLNLIHHLEDKYGGSVVRILKAQEERQERLNDLMDYDAARDRLRREMQEQKELLEDACRKLTEVRTQAASRFRTAITAELLDLNFRQVDFRVEISSGEEHLSAKGWDDIHFLISMNPGEPARPLESVASGGELSRIMLALKTVFAGKDDIHTFIFDEIDSGISGQTAWKVAQKMGRLSSEHQILCITHLPQIAAMEDCHFRIEKSVESGRTRTHIRRLDAEESTEELARMAGGDAVTEISLQSARELRARAAAEKII